MSDEGFSLGWRLLSLALIAVKMLRNLKKEESGADKAVRRAGRIRHTVTPEQNLS